jgi:hypothetical protein
MQSLAKSCYINQVAQRALLQSARAIMGFVKPTGLSYLSGAVIIVLGIIMPLAFMVSLCSASILLGGSRDRPLRRCEVAHRADICIACIARREAHFMRILACHGLVLSDGSIGIL